MTYTEAVQLALDGNERGFGFLYQNTYKSKLYLALQYMKNKSDAEDVLQDAYVKAFTNLKDLKDPEKFSSWLGQIVANTAKNALVKKNTVLFTDLPADEEEAEPFEEQIPDEDVSTQPELSYTKEETRQMVDELIDSLSDEQRVCILMYHMEDMPIKEIAETLDCSESTVKSRLNYGRKNLKAKVEEMQKKGYRLYSIAPLALLLLLLHTDAEAAYVDPSFASAGRQISNTVFKQISPFVKGTGSANPGPDGAQAGEPAGTGGPQAGAGAEAAAKAGAGGAAKAGAGGAAKAGAGAAAKAGAGHAAGAGLLGTTGGKVIIGVLAVAVAGGATFGVTRVVQNNREEEIVEEAPAVSQEEPAAEISGQDAAENENPERDESPEETEGADDEEVITDDADQAGSLRDLYAQVLQYALDGQIEYAVDSYWFDTGGPYIQGYQYFLTDMDNDGVQELIVAKVYWNGGYTFSEVFNWSDCHIFSADLKDGEWAVIEISGEIELIGATLPADGSGFIATTDFARGTGVGYYNRITIENETLVVGDSSGPGETNVDWYDADDLTGLDVIE